MLRVKMRTTYRLGLLCVMLGSTGILTVSLDPLMGIALVLLIAGTTLLREL
jgi:hypothetical protein